MGYLKHPFLSRTIVHQVWAVVYFGYDVKPLYHIRLNCTSFANRHRFPIGMFEIDHKCLGKKEWNETLTFFSQYFDTIEIQSVIKRSDPDDQSQSPCVIFDSTFGKKG